MKTLDEAPFKCVFSVEVEDGLQGTTLRLENVHGYV
jgi:hypothetical protein